ncbi:MAG TPA: M28 family peptidase [Longimicrobiales bacterium]|nr:M28 family peptidase [Longimicrobiales bacterium]
MSVLAADSLQGRGAGYRGDSLAAAYIAGVLADLGLAAAGESDGGRPSFLQRFVLHPRGPTKPFEMLRTQNVVALLEGSDPGLRDEVVVVGAHYDGQGMAGEADMGRRPAGGTSADSTWNSANDNASGTAALLAAAAALAEGERPRRSVLFIAFGAEEHGLAGSLHYVAHPTLPWERHVAMINLEMIGWEAERILNVRATGTSAEWSALLDSVTVLTGVAVTRNQPELTNDTDHYGFGVRGVPAIHYGVGGARDHYHAVSDDAERIAFEALAARTRHITALVRLVANRAAPLPFDWSHPRDHGLTGTSLTAAEIAMLGVSEVHGGVKVNAVAYGLAAHTAGLVPGDIILAINGAPLTRTAPGLRVLRDAMLEATAGGAVTVTVLRDGALRDFPLRFDR